MSHFKIYASHGLLQFKMQLNGYCSSETADSTLSVFLFIHHHKCMEQRGSQPENKVLRAVGEKKLQKHVNRKASFS